ncbi:hypothetical protein NL108_011763 [Boleophthalmus pectinirostris]|nr:hypothetical protein NL108_011763 [Boleophthalmus pectinirostris]
MFSLCQRGVLSVTEGCSLCVRGMFSLRQRGVLSVTEGCSLCRGMFSLCDRGVFSLCDRGMFSLCDRGVFSLRQRGVLSATEGCSLCDRGVFSLRQRDVLLMVSLFCVCVVMFSEIRRVQVYRRCGENGNENYNSLRERCVIVPTTH